MRVLHMGMMLFVFGVIFFFIESLNDVAPILFGFGVGLMISDSSSKKKTIKQEANKVVVED